VKNLAIARRYAKALLLIGKEDGKIDTYREELGAFANLVEQEKNLQQVLVNPLYDADGRKKVLTRVMDDLKLSQAMTTFLLFLFDKGRIGFLAASTTFSKSLPMNSKALPGPAWFRPRSFHPKPLIKFGQPCPTDR
jgi:F-type H+-transporting ATPase subunit delta